MLKAGTISASLVDFKILNWVLLFRLVQVVHLAFWVFDFKVGLVKFSTDEVGNAHRVLWSRLAILGFRCFVFVLTSINTDRSVWRQLFVFGFGSIDTDRSIWR